MVAEFKKLVASSGVKIDEQAFQTDLPFIKAMIRYDIDLSLFGVATARRHLIDGRPAGAVRAGAVRRGRAAHRNGSCEGHESRRDA